MVQGSARQTLVCFMLLFTNFGTSVCAQTDPSVPISDRSLDLAKLEGDWVLVKEEAHLNLFNLRSISYIELGSLQRSGNIVTYRWFEYVDGYGGLFGGERPKNSSATAYTRAAAYNCDLRERKVLKQRSVSSQIREYDFSADAAWFPKTPDGTHEILCDGRTAGLPRANNADTDARQRRALNPVK